MSNFMNKFKESLWPWERTNSSKKENPWLTDSELYYVVLPELEARAKTLDKEAADNHEGWLRPMRDSAKDYRVLQIRKVIEKIKAITKKFEDDLWKPYDYRLGE